MSDRKNRDVFERHINRIIRLIEECILGEIRPNPHGFISIKVDNVVGEWVVTFYNANYYKPILKKAGFIYENFGWSGAIDNLMFIKHEVLKNILTSAEKKDLQKLLEFVKKFYNEYSAMTKQFDIK